jgi:hypothetical protein
VIGAAVVVVLVAVAAVAFSFSNSSVSIAPKGAHGYDVSWPQCSGTEAHNLPPGSPPYVIFGLTDVGDHTVNPCLGSQLGWARSHGVRVGAYLLASYPTAAQLLEAGNGLYGSCGASLLCRLRNDGAAQAQQALATMTAAGVRAPRLWLDVEVRHVNPWSGKTRRNVALLQGIVRGLRVGHLPTGVYTTSYQWQQIAGDFRLDVPNWLPAGQAPASDAEALCSATATGGVTWLVQYTQALDSDLTCPPLEVAPGTQDTDFRLALIARPSL